MNDQDGSISVAAARAETPWERRYARRLIITDFLVVLWVVVGAQLTRFGLDSEDLVVRRSMTVTLNYMIVSLILVLAWMITLTVFATRDARIVGTGTTEYKRIFDASLRLFGIVAIVAFLLKIDVARSYVLLAFPIGVIALLLTRWFWRIWLNTQRRHGAFSNLVILLGSLDSVIATARDLDRLPDAGYRVVGACIPGEQSLRRLPGTSIPIFTDVTAMNVEMEKLGADTVIVAGADLPARTIRELSWSLEPGRQHLVVTPSITDVGGPRIHMRPVAGLPLMHVETPRYEGLKRFTKRAFDIVVSSLLIAILLPFLALIAVGVRLSTPGNVLFRQDRIGYRGRHFEMLKFRSMVPDAEMRLADLNRVERTEGNTVMFKMRDDPRVTPIGKILRRYSLDELPQLFNVFGGSMSLVGPRPPLEREVALYEKHVHRRFLVKPGITGLWQVSGRSNLSWEETVRLDLYYVENWSMTGDLSILWRTARAVVASEGAY